MSLSLSALGLKAVAPTVLAGYRALRHELDRKIGHDGLAGVDGLLEEAVAVLAGQADTLWYAVRVEAKAMVSRPPIFDKPVPRAWIATVEAQRTVKLAARAALRGEDDAPYAVEAATHYQLFLNDAEEPEVVPDANDVYAAALSYLLATLRRALTSGERMLLDAVHGLREHITQTRSSDGGGIFEAYIRDQIENLRLRRFFKSADTYADAANLLADLMDGRLAHTSASVRSWGLAWCARLLAFADVDLARSAVDYASQLVAAETLEIRVARAFVVAHDDFEAGLNLLDIDSGRLSATAAFLILRRGLGDEAALARATDAEITQSMLDGDGRFSWITAALGAGNWQLAFDAVRALEARDFDETPVLLWIAATVLVAIHLPGDLRRSVLYDVPLSPRVFPLSDEPQAIEQRRLAITFFERAATQCAALGLADEAAAATRYALWLNLRDESGRELALIQLHSRVQDPKQQLAYLPLALDFGLSVDMVRAEQVIRRTLARTTEPLPEVGAATVALLLQHAIQAPPEALAFLIRHRALISKTIDPASCLSLEIRLLHDTGQTAAAQALLVDAGARHLPGANIDVLASTLESVEAEPTIGALEALYTQDPQTGTLLQLLWRYLKSPYAPRFLELARRFLTDLANSHFALDFVQYLSGQGRDKESLELLTLLGDHVYSDAGLAGCAASVHFRLGNFQQAERLLARAEADIASADLRAMRFQLLIASGQWEALGSFLERQWQARADRPPLELVQLATLAAHLGVSLVPEFAQEAVSRAPTDPHVLMGAYSAVTTAGIEETLAEAGSWLMRAAEHSGSDGPVQQYDLQDLIDREPEWQDRVETAWREWARGALPLPALALSLRRSWLELQLAPLVTNPDVPSRQRRAVSLFSGRHCALPDRTSPGSSISIDRTALITLAAAEMLDPILEAFDHVHVPHDLLSDLFEQKNRIAFHQPSRIVFAHKLHEMLTRGRLKPFTPHTLVDAGLVAEIGHGLAALICEAHAQPDAQHFVIHPYPITRVGSLLREPAELGEYSRQIVSCSAVVDALEHAGRLTQNESKRAHGYLTGRDQRWPDEPVIKRGATLYLSDLSVDYLRTAGLLGTIEAAGLNVVVSPSEISQASDLRALEAQTGAIDEVIARVRTTLVQAAEAGRVQFVPAVAEAEDLNGYSQAIVQLVEAADVLVTDDRFINRYENFGHKTGTCKILSSLDLIETLSCQHRISAEQAEEARTWFRRAGVMLVGLDPTELQFALSVTLEHEGVLRETGELRAIRENLRLAQASGWFEPPTDIAWLIKLQDAVCGAIFAQWTPDIPDALARARSNWLLGILSAKDWAQTIVEFDLGGLAINGVALDLSKLVSLQQIANGSEIRFADWLQSDVLKPLFLQEPRYRDLLYDHLREMVRSTARDMALEHRDVSEHQARVFVLETFPNFLQIALVRDREFRKEVGISVEAVVKIGEAEFLRSHFLEAVRGVYEEPGHERQIEDNAGRSWALSTDCAETGWSLALLSGELRYLTKAVPGLHPDPVVRVGLFEQWLAERGMSAAGLGQWRARLEQDILDADEIEELETRLAELPGAVADHVAECISQGEASVATLVPASRRYFETLVGAGSAQNLDDFVRTVVPQQLARVKELYIEPDTWILLLGAHPSLLADGRFEARSPEEWRHLATWATDNADPLTLVTIVELGIAHVARDEALESLLCKLIDKIEGLDPADEDGDLHLFANLALFVDGEISQAGTLSDWPPFRRRMASLAHAALITRITMRHSGTAGFARFCNDERGWRFVVQNLVDMRDEPRWRPEHLGAFQMRCELLGRVVNAADWHRESLPPKLKARLFDEAAGLRSKLPLPMAFWPGPLEGALGPAIPSPPEAIAEALDRGLAEKTIDLGALTILTNVAAVFILPPDLIERAAARIRLNGARMLALFPAAHVHSYLIALAHVAASHRCSDLAGTVQAIARVHRANLGNERLHIGNEMHLALVAAAAHDDYQEWRAFLGNWIGELGHFTHKQEEAKILLTWTEVLCAIDSKLRTRVARTIASLRLLLDE